MKNSLEENAKLREHNQELMSDLSDVQELISNISDQNSAQTVYKDHIDSLEKENKICKKLIETKNEKIGKVYEARLLCKKKLSLAALIFL